MPRIKPNGANAGGSKRAKAKTTAALAAVEPESVQPESETQSASEALSASAALTLPDCIDSSAAAVVKDMLLERRGSVLVVDASQVRRVGAQSLQILVSAARTWAADGVSYSVTNPSSELLDTIALVGLPHEDLMLEGSC